MADPIIPLDLGSFMWRDLDATFAFVAEKNGFVDRKQKAQMYAGFLAAAAGAVLRDLGVADAVTILEGVTLAINEPRPKPTLTSVSPSTSDASK